MTSSQRAQLCRQRKTVPVTKRKRIKNAQSGKGRSAAQAENWRAARPWHATPGLSFSSWLHTPGSRQLLAVHLPSPDPHSHLFCPCHVSVATSSPCCSPWTATQRMNGRAGFFSDSHVATTGREGLKAGCGGLITRQLGAAAVRDREPYAGGARPPQDNSGWEGPLRHCTVEAAGLLRASRGSSPSLCPALVVNVLITVLMSCKWNPTSKYIRVMSSHLTNGDLIELLIGCLFPPRFMTPQAGAVRGGRGGWPRSACAPARPPASWPAPGPAASF